MTTERNASLRTAGPIAGGVAIAIVALALHPHLSGHPTARTALLQMGALSARDRLVHSTLLLFLGALLVGFARYAIRRGIAQLAVLVGFIAFALGVWCLMLAGLIDGFILPELAANFIGASAALQQTAVTILATCSVAVNVSTSFGLIAMAVGITAWSFDLLRGPAGGRTAGRVGCVSAAATIVLVVASGSSLTPHTLVAVFFLQGVWYVWIATVRAYERA